MPAAKTQRRGWQQVPWKPWNRLEPPVQRAAPTGASAPPWKHRDAGHVPLLPPPRMRPMRAGSSLLPRLAPLTNCAAKSGSALTKASAVSGNSWDGDAVPELVRVGMDELGRLEETKGGREGRG